MNTCGPMCACVRVFQGRTQRSMYPGKRSENTHLVCVCSCRVVLRVPPPLVHTAPHVAQAVIGDCEGSGEAEGDLLHPLAPQVRGVQGDLLLGVVGARQQRHHGLCHATLPQVTLAEAHLHPAYTQSESLLGRWAPARWALHAHQRYSVLNEEESGDSRRMRNKHVHHTCTVCKCVACDRNRHPPAGCGTGWHRR